MNKYVVAGVAAIALSGSALAAANAAGDEGQRATPKGAHRVVVSCDGGAQKQVKNRMVSDSWTAYETPGYQDIPGAGVSISGPGTGTDTLVVTFSGETQLRNATSNYDWMQLRVLLDGNPLPFFDTGSPMAFSAAPTYGMHSVTFCTKIGKGSHNIQVQTKLIDSGTDDPLQAWLDDYTLSVEKSN